MKLLISITIASVALFALIICYGCCVASGKADEDEEKFALLRAQNEERN